MTSGPEQKNCCMADRSASRSYFNKGVNGNIRSTKSDHRVWFDPRYSYMQTLGKRTYLPQRTRLVRKSCKFTNSPELESATTNTHQAQGKYLQHVVHCSCYHKPPPPCQCCLRITFGTPTPLFPSPFPPNPGAIMRSHSQTHESGSTLHLRPPRHRGSAYTWCIAHWSVSTRACGAVVPTLRARGLALGPAPWSGGTLCLPLSLCLLPPFRAPFFLFLFLLGGTLAVLLPLLLLVLMFFLLVPRFVLLCSCLFLVLFSLLFIWISAHIVVVCFLGTLLYSCASCFSKSKFQKRQTSQDL